MTQAVVALDGGGSTTPAVLLDLDGASCDALRLHRRAPGGGVVAARHPLLLERIGSGLTASAPLAELTLVTEPPVSGAIALALAHVRRERRWSPDGILMSWRRHSW